MSPLPASSRYAYIEIDGYFFWAIADETGWMVLDGPPWAGGKQTGEGFAYSPEITFHAPIRPSKIIAIGSNYRAHAAEMGKPIPPVPKIFFKPPSSVIGPGAPIVIPPGTERVDYEGELGVIIGRRCSRVRREDVGDYIFGYTLLNDVTARDFQKADGVFARAKGFDSFCPAGPVIVTGLDASDLPLQVTVDGVLRQDGRTSDMVFDIPTLIAFIADIMTLEPGDVISTGTPAGVGPLVAGNRVVVHCPLIGSLDNPVVNRDDRKINAG